MTPKLLSAEDLRRHLKRIHAAERPTWTSADAIADHIATLEQANAEEKSLHAATHDELHKLEQEHAALEADNAALLGMLGEISTACEDKDLRYGSDSQLANKHRACHDVVWRIARDAYATPHPGAHLLAEHAKTLSELHRRIDDEYGAKMEQARWAVMGRAAVEALRPFAKPEGEEIGACIARVLVRARNDGLEKAAQRFDVAVASLQRYADKATGEKTRLEWAEQVEVMEGFSRDIRAMKEPES